MTILDPKLKLSDDFTLGEMCVTDLPINNYPTLQWQQDNLVRLCLYLMQPIREEHGVLIVTSACRSPEVNRLKGGEPTSQHLFCEACDFIPKDANIREVFNWCIDNLIFGQCILEDKGGKQWIHISLPRFGKKNQEALLYNEKTGYLPLL